MPEFPQNTPFCHEEILRVLINPDLLSLSYIEIIGYEIRVEKSYSNTKWSAPCYSIITAILLYLGMTDILLGIARRYLTPES